MAVSYPTEYDRNDETPDALDALDALAQEWRARAAARLCATAASSYIYALDHYLRYLDANHLAPESMSTGGITAYIEECRAHCRRPRRPRRRASQSAALSASISADAPPQSNPCVSTLRTRLTAVRSFYDLLVERNVCVSNPLRGAVSLRRMAQGNPDIYPPQPKSRRTPRAWNPSPEEIAALALALDQASARDRLLVALLLDTGLPVQTLYTLPSAAIELQRHTLTLTPPGQLCLRCSPITARLYLCYVGERPLASHAAETPLLHQLGGDAGHGDGIELERLSLRKIGQRAGVPHFGPRELRQAHKRLAKLAQYEVAASAMGAQGGEQGGDSLAYWSALGTPVSRLLCELFPEAADEKPPHALTQTARPA